MALKTAWLFFGTIFIAIQLFHVSCAEVGDFHMNVTDDASGNLSIECSRTIEVATDFLCSFQLSNGTLITYKSVIGNKEENVTGPVRYGIIHPSSNVNKKVCKIQVYSPFIELESRKTWKCWIITGNQTIGTLVEKQLMRRSQSAVIGLPPVVTSNVHVKRGDDFIIGCQVMEPIVNCSFHSPHGNNFTVLNESRRIITPDEYKSKGKHEITMNPIRTLVYNSNFSMGDCFAIVSKAVLIHAGQWTCKMQLNNTEADVSINFTVAVQDSYLVASSTEDKSPKTISCTAIPGLSSKIVECEWKFSNNISISENYFPNITRLKNDTSCDLNFKDSKKSYEGNWTCNAKFKNNFGDEYNDTASITYSLSTTPNSLSNETLSTSTEKVGDFYMNVTDDTSANLSIECSRTIEVAKDFSCSFQLSNGIFITYKSVIGQKEKNVTGPVKYGIIHPSSDVSKKVCKIKVYPPFNDLRWRKAWKCWIITVNQTFGTIVEKQLKEVQPAPSNLPQVNIISNAVHVKSGDDFLIGCQVMEPIVNCSFHSPHGNNFTVLNESRRIITHDEYKSNKGKNEISMNPIRTLVYNSNFSMGDCFAIVSKAEEIHAGQWICKIQLNNTEADVSTNFTVAVKDSYLVASFTENKLPKTISCTAIPELASKIVECGWKFTNRVNVTERNIPKVSPTTDTSCKLRFTEPKKSYVGIWTCYATFENYFGDKYNDTAFITFSSSITPNSSLTEKPSALTEVGDFYMNVTDDASGNLSIECSRTIEVAKDFLCSFQLSNGTLITYKSVIGNKEENVTGPVKYKIIYPSSDVSKKVCKIQVYPPFNDLSLRKAWKCWIITVNQTFGTLVKKQLKEVQPAPTNSLSATNLKPVITANPVHVKHGDDFMVGCQVMEPIVSCSFQSPNRKIFTVPNESRRIITYGEYKSNKGKNKISMNPIRTLVYNSSFSMGDCFAIVSKADQILHAGQWACKLQLKNTKKIVSEVFTVAVNDSYLVASFTENKLPKTISCTAIPGLSSKIVECEWKFSNGIRISENNYPNITHSKNDTSCNLTFKVGDFYMNVTDDTSGNLSIECSRTIEVAKDFLCSFQLSNGTLIRYKSVIGHEEQNVTGPVKYGIIHPSSDVSKKVCKIKVYPPFNDLRWRKAWKCWIITVNQTFGTIVEKQLKEVQSAPSNLPQVNITSNAVHVKRGDDFMVNIYYFIK
ncbi:hypothetical protein HCN44_003772 [Aphidius gifuensis]|uniref:Uncharacterized protein n=1 Tax=Aphidius gifuensis TaxID=684658 RepID=A0A834XMA4_APHGI|nr:hypothetical protein HCN44_003772 [Aphidius gifuensis]